MIENILLWTNTVAFGMVLAKDRVRQQTKLPGVQKASAAIMGIAMTQYAITAIIHGKNRTVAQDLRTSTGATPLLCIRTGRSPERGKGAYVPMAVAVVTMIALGFAAEVQKRQERKWGCSPHPWYHTLSYSERSWG
jgi:hypothetical protein